MALTKTGTDGIKDDAITLDKLTHGTSSQDGKFLRANNGAAPTFETVNTDLSADTSPQLGGYLDSNGYNIQMLDNNRLRLGTSFDLDIYHDGSNSRIKNTTGSLWLQSDTAIRFVDADVNESMAAFYDNGAVELYYDGSKKFETTSGGGTLTGDWSVSNDFFWADNGEAVFGTGGDFKIYHDGTHNYLNFVNGALIFTDNGTNRAYFHATDGHFLPWANNTYDLGSTTNRWRNIYTNDLNLSNEGSSNDVDGTWGDWTIQEGESDLFLKNNRSGKKYKFNLTEVS